MALNFPNSPTIGQVYTDTTSGFSYEWDGTVWKSYRAVTSIASTASFATTSFGLSGSPNIIVGVSTFSGIATHTASLFGTQASFSGVVTATSFTGNLTGTASTASFATTSFGLSGSPNITVGSITSGNINSSGIVTATSAVVGSAVTVNSSGINVTGVVTATSFVGSGSGLTGLNIPAGYTELDSMLFG